MRKKYAQMFVAPEFKTKIKLESTMNEMSIFEYTKRLARDNPPKEEEQCNRPKKRGFGLGF